MVQHFIFRVTVNHPGSYHMEGMLSGTTESYGKEVHMRTSMNLQ